MLQWTKSVWSDFKPAMWGKKFDLANSPACGHQSNSGWGPLNRHWSTDIPDCSAVCKQQKITLASVISSLHFSSWEWENTNHTALTILILLQLLFHNVGFLSTLVYNPEQLFLSLCWIVMPALIILSRCIKRTRQKSGEWRQMKSWGVSAQKNICPSHCKMSFFKKQFK